ncbi:MAG TPA: RsmG family class I SAM-dependent methyltransferase [Acidimicrobiales bacterium]|nr:RsmG family class I SAM-dependent methyltransferase [Acidimicrobiales bacterium]
MPGPEGPLDDGVLIEILEEARDLGFLGPGAVVDHIDHAAAFLAMLDTVPEGRSLDLGSGGGVPGLVLAKARPSAEWVLLDASSRRTAFLTRAVAALGLAPRVHVVTGRAEELARRKDHRGSYQLVVARSFARPAVVAECAAPVLAVGGALVVSEPPGGEATSRWSEDGLQELGLRVVESARDPRHLVRLHQERPCPERFPRRVGVPSKRPLW